VKRLLQTKEPHLVRAMALLAVPLAVALVAD
jgi:hypothetical protein